MPSCQEECSGRTLLKEPCVKCIMMRRQEMPHWTKELVLDMIECNDMIKSNELEGLAGDDRGTYEAPWLCEKTSAIYMHGDIDDERTIHE